jgi:hypothetical protein
MEATGGWAALKRNGAMAVAMERRRVGSTGGRIELMAGDWVRFDEYEDVLASTDLLAIIAPGLREQRSRWKWMILAAHNALQGAIVCAIQDSTGTNVLNREPAIKMLNWLDTNEGEPPREYLADFITLLKKYRKTCTNAGVTARQLKNMKKLHREFRNIFAHFTPKHWSIEAVGLPAIIESALDLIETAMQQHQVVVHMSGNRKRRLDENLSITRAALASISRRLIAASPPPQS